MLSRMLTGLCALITLAGICQEVRIERPGALDAPTSAKPGALDPQQKKRGLEMLKAAEAGASGLEGGMRAWTSWQIARCYERFERAKAIELLESAVTASRSIDDDRMKTRTVLQERILADMVSLSPERVNELLPFVDVEARKHILTKLLGYYEKNENQGRAIEFIYRLAYEDEVPYDSVDRLMLTMKPEQWGDYLQLFTTALSSYTAHSHTRFESNGFPELLVEQWTRLPKDVVRTSIDEVLKQADPANRKESANNQTYSVTSSQGSASFNSIYEYRLFQMLPLLRKLDEAAAEQALKRYRDVAVQLQRYPQGMSSLMPTAPAIARNRNNPAGGVAYSVSDDAANTPFMIELGLMQKYVEEAEAGYTDDALAHAGTLQDPQLRGACYHNMARVTMKKYPAVARTAVERMIETAPKVTGRFEPQPFFELMSYRAAADVYLLMGDEAAAKRAILKGLALCSKLYDADANADDPNKALKAFWASTDSYRALLRQSAKISAPWAIELLNEITDPEIKVVAQISLASTWLGVSPGQVIVMANRKSDHGTMTGGVEAEE